MLGLRGCRLGIDDPGHREDADPRHPGAPPIAVKRAGGDPIAEIMIPLVGHVNELERTRELLDARGRGGRGRRPASNVDFKFGTMIEIPRAALVADEIAEHAEFFSFGTNDLTQMTFGYSRDDAGAIPAPVRRGEDPAGSTRSRRSTTWRRRLMQMAVEKGRAARPDLEVGICGEHGGDPDVDRLLPRDRADYVSCSPFRVPSPALRPRRPRCRGPSATNEDDAAQRQFGRRLSKPSPTTRVGLPPVTRTTKMPRRPATVPS